MKQPVYQQSGATKLPVATRARQWYIARCGVQYLQNCRLAARAHLARAEHRPNLGHMKSREV
eukprot:CAMPEP_0179317780 /NCGR_PEP_ID=MMETSP0797-20121207/56482_1 /TAXON_ID=47934 /ORGANISM="Dinophysis acuminata, Strain DAEP01" /LENGTH=61 /DNA_ID=CAMNT_0021028803 /DNA_START=68 /DNA_END=250 /DNA_ORIENTATION=-